MPKFTIKIGKKVEKFLAKRPIEFRRRFLVAAQKLAIDPFRRDLYIVLFETEKKVYRLRLGKYRFLYELNRNEIYIYFYKADSRGDIY